MIVQNILKELADNGVKVNFDLEKGDVVCNKQKFIENGQLVMTELKANKMIYNLENLELLPVTNSSFWSMLEDAYEVYMNSVPSETSNQLKTFFKAKTYEELTDEEMIKGLPRLNAHYLLHLTVIAMRNKVEWKSGWFWKSNKYKDLVVLKSWVVSE